MRSQARHAGRYGFESRSRQVGRGGIVVVSEPTFFGRRFVYSLYTHLRQLHVITDQPVAEAYLLRYP